MEYSIRPLGGTLEEPIKALYAWTLSHSEAVLQAQAAFDARTDDA